MPKPVRYLYTAALTQPIDSDWMAIYLYITTKVYSRWRKGEIPGDIKVESLTDDQRADLNRLKEWLHGRCAQARLERDRDERREKAKAAQAEHEAMQPSLFDF